MQKKLGIFGFLTSMKLFQWRLNFFMT